MCDTGKIYTADIKTEMNKYRETVTGYDKNHCTQIDNKTMKRKSSTMRDSPRYSLLSETMLSLRSMGLMRLYHYFFFEPTQTIDTNYTVIVNISNGIGIESKNNRNTVKTDVAGFGHYELRNTSILATTTCR